MSSWVVEGSQGLCLIQNNSSWKSVSARQTSELYNSRPVYYFELTFDNRVRVDNILTFLCSGGSRLYAKDGQIILLLSFWVTDQRYFRRSEIYNSDLIYRLEVVLSPFNPYQCRLQLSCSGQRLILEGRSPNTRICQSFTVEKYSKKCVEGAVLGY